MFTASGAVGLAYQIIWARWLGFVFGNTAVSIAVVLASFMLGLALGAWFIGRVLDRISNALWCYALLEIVIGLFALSFPLLHEYMESFFLSLVSVNTPAIYSLSQRSLLSFMMLIIPTSCMGATLPLLSKFFREYMDKGGSWKAGNLYAMNTLGAALGTLLASFLLIELIGVRATNWLAASGNFMVAFLALRYARSVALKPRPIALVHDHQLPSGKLPGNGLLTIAALTGATALASEVLWTRMLEVLIGNSTYAFGMILVVFLLGIAIGSGLMARVTKRVTQPVLLLAGVQLGMAVWTILAMQMFNYLAEALQAYRMTSVAIPKLLEHHVMGAALLLPLALLSGAVFPLATRILDWRESEATGESVARVYTWNTLGGVAGSLVAGFVIAVNFGYMQAIAVLAIFYGLTAIGTFGVSLNLIHPVKRMAGYARAGITTLALLVVGYSGMLSSNQNPMRQHLEIGGQNYHVISNEPGLQGITTVLQREQEPLGALLLVNGAGMTAKVTDTKMMAHLPLALHKNPQNTLVICFGMGTTYRSALSHNGKVTVVELVAEVLDAFDLFYDDAKRYRDNARGQMVVTDGRNFLELTREKFDVITIDPPPPIDAAGVNNLYSREFALLARERLAVGGIFAHWVPFPWAAAGVDGWQTFNMLVATFSSAFPYTAMIPGLHNVGVHLLGSTQPINLDPIRIRTRLQLPEISADLNEWQTVPSEYYDQIVEIPNLPDVPLVTDDRPRLEFNLIRLWRAGIKKLHPLIYW